MLSLLKRILSSVKTLIAIKRNPVGYARDMGVKVGKDVRLVAINGGTFGSEPYLIEIGDRVTITGGVQFVTHDGGVWVFREKHPDIDVFGQIVIGNNVFIGFGAIIMPGVNIGDNVVIGAGSVVAKDIPANHVAVGSPAKPIKTIDEYYTAVMLKKDNTKHLSAAEKKQYLLKKFSADTDKT